MCHLTSLLIHNILSHVSFFHQVIVVPCQHRAQCTNSFWTLLPTITTQCANGRNKYPTSGTFCHVKGLQTYQETTSTPNKSTSRPHPTPVWPAVTTQRWRRRGTRNGWSRHRCCRVGVSTLPYTKREPTATATRGGSSRRTSKARGPTFQHASKAQLKHYLGCTNKNSVVLSYWTLLVAVVYRIWIKFITRFQDKFGTTSEIMTT